MLTDQGPGSALAPTLVLIVGLCSVFGMCNAAKSVKGRTSNLRLCSFVTVYRRCLDAVSWVTIQPLIDTASAFYIGFVAYVSQWHHWSAASHQLTVPPHWRTTYGGRAFAVAGPSMWNSLPKRLRDPSHSTSVCSWPSSQNIHFLRVLVYPAH